MTETAIVPEVLSKVPAVHRRKPLTAADFFANLSARTRTDYASDWRDFARFYLRLRKETCEVTPFEIDRAFSKLVTSEPGDAYLDLCEYQQHGVERGHKHTTINRRIAAVRSALKFAKAAGKIVWTADVKSLPSENYRNTTALEVKVVRRLHDHLQKRTDKLGRRDLLLFFLLTTNGLRRNELITLDLKNIEIGEESATIWVKAKGRHARQKVDIAGRTRKALEAWLAVRGDADGPLLLNLARSAVARGTLERLSSQGLYSVVRRWGKAIGVSGLRPHLFRHYCVTRALDCGNGLREVQRLSRHRSLNVLLVYDGNRSKMQLKISEQLAADLEGEEEG